MGFIEILPWGELISNDSLKWNIKHQPLALRWGNSEGSCQLQRQLQSFLIGRIHTSVLTAPEFKNSQCYSPCFLPPQTLNLKAVSIKLLVHKSTFQNVPPPQSRKMAFSLYVNIEGWQSRMHMPYKCLKAGMPLVSPRDSRVGRMLCKLRVSEKTFLLSQWRCNMLVFALFFPPFLLCSTSSTPGGKLPLAIM